MKKMLFISNCMHGEGLSGGDRIWIELAKRWNCKFMLEVFTSVEAKKVCEKLKITDLKFVKLLPMWQNYNLIFNLIYRIINSIRNLPGANNYNMVYSTSDLWPDVIPAFFMKVRNPDIKWIAGFYLFAPNPWGKDSPYKDTIKNRTIGFFYWLMQRLFSYWCIKKYADIVFVTSEPDVDRFVTKKRSRNKIVVIRGGVDIKASEEYFSSLQVIPIENRVYDTCFVGRFHYQKGVLELVDIWKLVCEEEPSAKLAMIGNGPLETTVRDKICNLGLKKNIDLLGFRDGDEKYKIFKESKLVVHPATYDSGGMAAAEAMAWGLPGVSFDLEALKTYYPKGMLKTKCFNTREFAKNILLLLRDTELYNKLHNEALDIIRDEWNWDKRADYIYGMVSTLD